MIETLGEGFHSEDLTGHLRKLDPNKSGSLDHFSFVRWYLDKEVSLDSADESERLVGWDCKSRLMYLQWEFFWRLIHWSGNRISKSYLWRRFHVCSLWDKEEVWQNSFIRPGINLVAIGELLVRKRLSNHWKFMKNKR